MSLLCLFLLRDSVHLYTVGIRSPHTLSPSANRPFSSIAFSRPSHQETLLKDDSRGLGSFRPILASRFGHFTAKKTGRIETESALVAAGLRMIQPAKGILESYHSTHPAPLTRTSGLVGPN